KLLWEFQEHAIGRREIEEQRAFISARSDRYRASYGRHAVDVPRTCVFVSTSNTSEVLHDPEGARRFMPVRVHGVDVAGERRVDVDGIKRDRLQVLGEAASRVLAGERHWL